MQRCRTCAQEAIYARTWCEKHWHALVERLRKRVKDDVLPLAAEMYIGRTHHPERRLLEHVHQKGVTHMVVLHWAASWDEAAEMETALINQFSHLYRLTNETDVSAGRFGSAWNAIYVVFALKPGETRRAADVTSLPLRERLWPVEQLGSPVWLRSSLAPMQAAAVVGELAQSYSSPANGAGRSRRTATRAKGTGKV